MCKVHGTSIVTGDAVITKAYGSLKVSYVIHAVGPVWRGGHHGERELLSSAYLKSYQLAEEHQCASILMPAISTGVYGYPLEEAVEVAVTTSQQFLKSSKNLEKIEFILFGNELLNLFMKHI